MKIPKQFLQTATITILVGLVVFCLFAIIFSLFGSEFDPVPYIAAISTLAIALLTVAYVLTTSGQLRVMRRQLEEMERSRQLDSQPLPILTISKISIEPPRLFYSPPEDLHSFHTRLRVDFSVKNHSSFPAINVVASSAMIVAEGKSQEVIRCASEQVDVLAGDQTYPSDGDKHPGFLFCDDRAERVLTHLRQKTLADLPLLPVHITFTNVLGGCFAVDAVFRLVPSKPEDDEILKKWDTQVVSFRVEYKRELADLERLRKEKQYEEWDKLFESVKTKLKAEAGEKALEISWLRLPNTFRVRSIPKEQYQEEMSQTGFGHPVPSWCNGCIHKPEE